MYMPVPNGIMKPEQKGGKPVPVCPASLAVDVEML
eukprot:COSAG01_NODE_10520_length_2144_cov_5.140831_1_plen_34_part_10